LSGQAAVIEVEALSFPLPLKKIYSRPALWAGLEDFLERDVAALYPACASLVGTPAFELSPLGFEL
jgi:hypothetical protein